MAKHPTGTLTTDLLTVCEALEQRYGRRKPVPPADIIESLAYQILELGTTEKAARDALKRLRDEFVDWNDMRVGTVREIQDILGERLPKCRERAEDLKALLADLWTAFRRMDLGQALDAQGIETLRALPDTTNIRRDNVDRTLAQMMGLRVFPNDDDQFRQLKLLGGVPKPWNREQMLKRVDETPELDTEFLLRLHRVLREHVLMWQAAGKDEPQPIGFGWDQPDPLGMGKPEKKPDAKPEKKPDAKPEKKPDAKPEKKPDAKPEKKKPEAKAGKKPAAPAKKK